MDPKKVVQHIMISEEIIVLKSHGDVKWSLSSITVLHEQNYIFGNIMGVATYAPVDEHQSWTLSNGEIL